MHPRYTIERWPHGWTISSTGDMPGIPIDALGECMPMFPKKAHLDTGIAHHLKTFSYPSVILCVVHPDEGIKWRAEIESKLANHPPEARWWHGFDVGKSSAAIFSCFSTYYPGSVASFAAGAVPTDSSDLGRCISLLNLFPEWRENLQRVALVYPNTLWPQIIARWSELEAASPADQTKILTTLTQGS